MINLGLKPHRSAMSVALDLATARLLADDSDQRQHFDPRAPSIDLPGFIAEAWHIVEPARFISGWHIDVIAEVLTAVSFGEIRDLIINVPPRSGKSTLVSVMWPAWEWTWNPTIQHLFASYGQDLSVRDALKSRRIMDSDWYRRQWRDLWDWRRDENRMSKYANTLGGHRIATSMAGRGTGEGGDHLVVDDPHKVQEAESDTEREAVIRDYDETFSTRGNDPKTFARVVVMQRLHQRDLTQHLLDKGGWEHLMLPAEYDPQRITTIQGRRMDPRSEEGELLCPERQGPEELTKLKRDLETATAISGQLQQDPVPRQGALFKSAEFRALPADFDVVDEEGDKLSPRQRLSYYQFWDLAYSEEEWADYTASITVGYDKRAQHFYITNAWRTRVEELDDKLQDDDRGLGAALRRNIALQHPRPIVVGVWSGVFAKKSATVDLCKRVMIGLAKESIGLRVIAVPERGDKVERAQLPVGRLGIGSVYVDKTAPWWNDLEAELLAFWKGRHDDWVDCLSGCFALILATPMEESMPMSVSAG